ncbi:MAG TPA: plasma-membrane proton-efflux P-type ATPase [Methanoregulaceae archaeon]|nr:plasma-membrane proton-efflux P-type ATPase [Methanoregulaceae archaeon]
MPEEIGVGDSRIDYQSIGVDELARVLDVHTGTGLSAEDVRERHRKFGYNEVAEKRVNPWIRFAGRFWGPTAWVLEAVILLSFVLGNDLDVYIIVALLLFNAVLGFFEEQKASGAVRALQRKLRVNTRALRDGRWQMLPARELVPGDAVRVRAGDFIPADLKALGGPLEVDQSALTGESLPIRKERSDLLFSGSIIQSGEADALVVSTGTRTYFGKTAELVQVAEPRLHAEEVIAQVVRWLLVIVGVALTVAFIGAALIGIPVLTVIPLALVLLASSIPVALPAMFTITMAIGSMELARRGVLVTRLSAAEDAATMDTLCSDKTGTITTNTLSVAGVAPANGMSEEDVLRYSTLASLEADRDPIDRAFISAASDRHVSMKGFTRRSFTPFDPRTRRTVAVVESGGTTITVAKGAVNVMADLTGADPNELGRQAGEFAAKGYRTLAVAMGNDEQSLRMVGLVALYDRPRPDARALIGDLGRLGVSVKMLTGDALPIARETARQVGIPDAIITATEFGTKRKGAPEAAARIAEQSSGFAEIYPEDKYLIVRSLQRIGHIVGMTGDGVNDAPSLRQAEVGIAVSTASDVAKGAASVVLTGDGLENIVDLVRVGRMTHQRMLTWILNKVVKTFQIVVFVVVAFLLTGHFIVSVFDVVLLLFVVDFVTLSLSTDNVRGSPRPDSWEISGLVRSSLVLGVLVVLESLGILLIGLGPLGRANDYGAVQTFSFAILFYLGMLTVFVVRERGHFWESFPSMPLFASTLIDMIVVTVLVTVGIPGLAPIPLVDTLTVAGLSVFFSFAINDTVKYRMLGRRDTGSGADGNG